MKRTTHTTPQLMDRVDSRDAMRVGKRAVKFLRVLARPSLTAALACSNYLHAADTQDLATNSIPPETSSPATTPLMAGLSAIGLGGTMNKANLNLSGYAEGGYFHDFSSPDSGTGPTYVGFNNYKNQVVLNKLDLSIERTVDPTRKQFDVGFRAEGLWGTDAASIHSNGLLDNQTTRYQWDLVQAYLDIAVPDLPLRIRVGKWIELAGFEQFSANIYGAFGDPMRALYSYSYQFLYAEPGTQSGILATYFANPHISFDVGVTRGWNQSVKDNNGSVDFLGRLTYTPTDKTSIIFVTTIGPEFSAGVGPGQPQGNFGDTWTALDLVLTHKLSDQLSLGFGGDFVNVTRLPGYDGSQQFGGVAGYISYAISPYITVNNRIEWYGANSGFSTGAPTAASYYEETLGVAIKPAPHHAIFKNMLIRPEIRYDWANKAVYASGSFDQLTFSVDALFTF